MKKITTIFLLLFLLNQAYPSVMSLFSEISTFISVDTEKGEDNKDNSKNEKKSFITHTNLSSKYSHQINIAFHLVEKIHPSPWLEQLTPPPNFC